MSNLQLSDGYNKYEIHIETAKKGFLNSAERFERDKNNSSHELPSHHNLYTDLISTAREQI